MNGPCVKATVRCTLIAADGRRFVGENWCANPQPVCPRAPGEDYEKCRTVCRQEGHAEIVALRLAGADAQGAHAYVEGHTYACRDCQEAIFAAGVAALTMGSPPSTQPSCSKEPKIPMHELVNNVAKACEVWLDVDAMPSPPATAAMLQATDRSLAAAIEDLCRAYPQQMGCDRHPSGRAALSWPGHGRAALEGEGGEHG